jgi:hypothetical protein
MKKDETSKYDASYLHDHVHCGIYAHCSFTRRTLNENERS